VYSCELPVNFGPGVKLYLTESSVIRIKEIFTESMKSVKDDNGMVAASKAKESMMGNNSGASTKGKGANELYCYSKTGTSSTTRSG